MSDHPRFPLVGVIADRRMVGEHPFHMAGEKYLRAVTDGAAAYPVVLPSFAKGFEVSEVLDRLDGLFLTGSPSNVEPHHYEGPASAAGTWHDPERDGTAFDLIPAALEQGVPLLAVCRGFQEMNVAMGGTLHQEISKQPDYHVHHEDSTQPLDVQYGPAHEVSFMDGGLLQRITGRSGCLVNSLHHQGIDRLGEGLAVEAVADDGLIEAFVVEGTPGFNLSVQWHPEWQVTRNPVSMALFEAFGKACRAWATEKK